MRRFLALLLVPVLCGCAAPAPATEPVPTVTTVPETTVPETTIPPTTAPLHSDYYLEDCPLEDLLVYWDEVVLQMEYTDGTGDPSRVQKWLSPLLCRIEGEPTGEDLTVLEAFFEELNRIPGFPGIALAAETQQENLTLSFLGAEDFRDSFSEAIGGEDAWGADQFWYYTDTNEIHTARIGCRTDIPQAQRSSIILEELVNTLGISDTVLRPDSIVYQYSNENLSVSGADWLILKLLYHPGMECGMDRDACHAVIETLYH